jgi:hypothetical protein
VQFLKSRATLLPLDDDDDDDSDDDDNSNNTKNAVKERKAQEATNTTEMEHESPKKEKFVLKMKGLPTTAKEVSSLNTFSKHLPVNYWKESLFKF